MDEYTNSKAQTDKSSDCCPSNPFSMFKITLISSILLLACSLFYLGYQFSLSKPEVVQPYQNEPSITKFPTLVVSDLTADWKIFSNNQKGFSFRYPRQWDIFEIASKNGGGQIIIDPIKINQEQQGANPVRGLISIYYADIFSEPLGYLKFPLENIGTNKTIESRKLETNSGNSSPNAAYNNKHTIIYYINRFNVDSIKGGIEIHYTSDPSDQYLNEFNQVLSTFKLLDLKPPLVPPATSSKKLTYSLPVGWSTARDKGENFEIGYNPTVYQIITPIKNNYISLGNKNYPGAGTVSFGLVPYNGGSRHQLIYDHLGYNDNSQAVAIDKSDNYYEKEYLYNGSSCLILYGLNFSASGNVWGMCALSPTKAVFFGGIGSETDNEKLIQTFRLLK